MKQHLVTRRAAAAALAAVVPALCHAAAWAQDAGAAAPRGRLTLGESVLGTLIFGAIGIVLAIAGFKLFDVVVRHNIEQEIFENKNMAAALLGGAIILGVSLIIAATILS